jgi:phenylalanyl-tRNA synthetase beta chain
MPADSPLRDSLKILNPLGEDTSIMRTTLLPSMLDILTRNYNFRNERAFLYEIGRSYHKRPDGLAAEPKTVSIGAYGPEMDFFVLKGLVEELLEALGIPAVDAKFSADRSNPAYHPGQCAVLTVNGESVGILGRIHPRVMKNYGVDGAFYCAQLSFESLFRLQGGTPVFQALPRFPAVTRDIAVVCDLAIPAGDMKDAILDAGGDCLKDCRIFDVYTGHHIAEGKKSVAFSLTIRSDDHTLTDEDADSAVKNVLSVLKERFGAEMR